MTPHIGFNCGLVVSRKDWTDILFSLRVKIEGLSFIAGQFTKLGLYDAKGEFLRKAYSIVNSPEDYAKTEELEFLIIADLDGALSPNLHTLHPNDEVMVGDQCAGFMTLDEVPQHATELWLMATGTGIGPYLSILQTEDFPEHYTDIILVHAVRFQQDLVYKSLIEELKQKFAGKLQYVPIVSREKLDEGLTGRVPHLIDQRTLESHTGVKLDMEKTFVYLCGNPAMVRESGLSLSDRGYHKHLRRKTGHFSSENYW
ncbi:ferredoxin--NADP(+) reductase [Vibrio sp. UCD-FRSSP16_10]|uniref:ferredoxin--NADP reductase n=1 Tax=unclassified Vibrio TaxID=2614977 RepID=UPI00080031BA|nr:MULTISPECIES: ferredoxin--NADP reductase [unclassified Vibrio]OBT13882.1 ferredoxin--NADP(+) reductase [Vibrio sp. UCD-FRSSP16_30]OBT22763.1 ferredoxin--NADP(+) reductase [Vibrio sp. UCD-FRSSP16_10]